MSPKYLGSCESVFGQFDNGKVALANRLDHVVVTQSTEVVKALWRLCCHGCSSRSRSGDGTAGAFGCASLSLRAAPFVAFGALVLVLVV